MAETLTPLRSDIDIRDGGRPQATGTAPAGARESAREHLYRLLRRVTVVRVAFGLVWAVDAWYKWQPTFGRQFLSTITRSGHNAPAPLQPWFHFWGQIVSPHAAFFALMTAVAETTIAGGLIFGIARRPLYLLGAVFSLLIWTVPESFGRFWTAGQTDLGTSIMYVLIFLALFAVDTHASTAGWSLDRWLAGRLPAWKAIADL